MLKYPDVYTDFDEDTNILSVRYNPVPAMEVFRQVQKHMQNDTEGKVRDALIALGWTPPTN